MAEPDGLASLPMYDLAELRWATDALWQAIAGALRAAGVPGVPQALDRRTPPERVWADPALVLSQTCGYPLLHGFAGRLRPVATPCYAAPGCTGPAYRSAVVVPAQAPWTTLDALRGRVLAVNGWDSQSGWNALAALVAPLARAGRFFGAARLTGSHAASLEALAEGRADCAAIDCVTVALLARHRPAAVAGTRILAWTEPAPGLPYVARADLPDAAVATLRRALEGALHAPLLRPALDALLLTGFAALDLADYRPIARMAVRAGTVERPPILA